MPQVQDGTKAINGDELQLVSFSLGDEMFGIEVSQVRDIVRVDKVTKVPKMPEFIEGVVNLRGQILTVINLRRRFTMEDKERDRKSRIITGEINNSQFGIIVDSVSEVIRVPTNSIEKPPEIVESNVDANYLTGICKMDDNLIMLLDLERILSDDEFALLGKAAESGRKEI